MAELPQLLSCSVSGAGKDESKKVEIAEIFISNAIRLSQSKRKASDYEMQIINNTAYFTHSK